MAQHAFDRLMSRPIILGWAMWLLASWTVNWLLDGPLRVTDIAITPVVRWTIIMALIGLSIYWPLTRLTQTGGDNPSPGGIVVLADAWGLMLVFQVILWPMRFLAGWTIQQTLLIDLAVVMHATVTMLWIMLGRRGGQVLRTLMMALCLATLIVPAVQFASRGDETALALSPVRTVWVLTDQWPFLNVTQVMTWQAAIIAAALAVAGVMIALNKPRTATGSSPADPPIA